MNTALLTVYEQRVGDHTMSAQLRLSENGAPAQSVGSFVMPCAAWDEYIRPRLAYTYNFCRVEFIDHAPITTAAAPATVQHQPQPDGAIPAASGHPVSAV